MRSPNPLIRGDEALWYDAGSVWEQRGRDWYDRLALALLDRDAATAIRWVGRFGGFAQTCRLHGPKEREIVRLFGRSSRIDARRIAFESAARRYRNRAAIAFVQRRGIRHLAELVEHEYRAAPNVVAARSRGLILAAYHLGAHHGVGAALHWWGVSALVLRDLPLAGTDDRARALKTAVDTLRAGGVVMAAVDGPGGGSSNAVPCMGRRIVLRRGAFMLARVTNTPIVPVIARWTSSGRIAAWTGEPLGAADRTTADEHALTAAAARWLERHLSVYPEDIWPYMVQNLLASPPA